MRNGDADGVMAGSSLVVFIWIFLWMMAPLPSTAGTIPPPELIEVDDSIMFAGNSITWSPRDEENRTQWWGDYGMAATDAFRAFPALVALEVAARNGETPEVNIYKSRVIFEEDIDEELFAAILREHPTYFVLQTGEAFSPDRTQAQWNELFAPLGEVVREVGAIGVVAGIFGTKSVPGVTPGDNKQEQMREAVELAGLRFAPLVHLHIQKNLGFADGVCTTTGVCGHPGDAGHKGIAEEVLRAIYGKVYLPAIHQSAGTIP